MSSFNYSNPFGICFNIMKIKYTKYDSTIDSLNFVSKNDKVNVFINFESILNNLSSLKDIDNKLLLERNFTTILESETLNLCAHYKKFFKGNGLPTRIFLYYTDLSSLTFTNFKYNDEYRSFYINKYLNNPKFQLLGNKLIDTIIPRIKKIIEFIPDVYFITAKDIEGSLIPYIIYNDDKSYKNFIISTDKYDTQYQLMDKNFCLHYIKKSPLGSSLIYSFNNFIKELFKDSTDNYDLSIFTNSSFYSTLLSSMGNKMRSLDPLKGIGYKSIIKFLLKAINDGLITKDTTSFDLISRSLPEDQIEHSTENFKCTDIITQYNDLTSDNIFSITNQIIDRSDYNSLILLNQSMYKDYPLMLPELTC